MMHERGKSDRPIVPKKPSNKELGAPSSAEEVEGRGLAKGNSGEQNKDRALDREALQSALIRIRQAAKKDKKLKFTTLWHHVYDIRRLREAFLSMKKKAAAGVDGVTWQQYNENREKNLLDLSERLKRGAYRAKPVRRKFIPKADGRERPLGIPALEDKLVQGVTAEVLNAIYEEDFLGFSYGFRPGRGPHNALDAVTVGITKKKVNFVLDADIRGFYDAVDHEWLVKFVELRIGDERVVRHIKKWLNAGVLENGKRTQTTEGTPQGSSVSPVLANIYLHYAFDLFAHQWRQRKARGEVIIVRYADDILMGFQYRDDAERFRQEMEQRLARFKLELHPDKTRLLEFGRFAAENLKKRNNGKPETFDFLGFTHICGKKKSGKYAVLRKTIRKRMCAKLMEVKTELRTRMHEPIPIVGKWLASVLRGHFQYYGVPWNTYSLYAFRRAVIGLWYQVTGRRSQTGQMSWRRMSRLAASWLPTPRIQHPYPEQRLRV